MDYKVVFKSVFLADLESIVRRIAKENPIAAQQLGALIIRTGESLSFLPERHRQVRQRRGIRRLVVHRHFKVFYRVNRESRTVEILRCWDGRRESDPPVY